MYIKIYIFVKVREGKGREKGKGTEKGREGKNSWAALMGVCFFFLEGRMGSVKLNLGEAGRVGREI